MNTEILITLLGVISSGLTGFIGWFVGRRKQNAESSILEITALKEIRGFYEAILKDNNTQISQYIQLAKEDREDLRNLRIIVDNLIDDSCLKKGCSDRIYYDARKVNSILDSVSKLRKEV